MRARCGEDGKAVVWRVASERSVVRVSQRKNTCCGGVSKRLSYLSPLDSPCIHRFFLNLSDSFSFALLRLFRWSVPLFPFALSSAITLGLLLHFGSHELLHVDRLLVASSLGTRPRKPRPRSSMGTRPQKPRPRNQSVTDIYIYIYTYIQTRADYAARLVASR